MPTRFDGKRDEGCSLGRFLFFRLRVTPHVARETFLVDHLFAMGTFLRRKRPLLSMRVFRAVPSLMLIEAGAVELALAISTDAPQFKFGLW